MEKWKRTLATPEGSFGYVIEEARQAGRETMPEDENTSKDSEKPDTEKWIRIADYSGTDIELHIPSQIDGMPVKVLTKKTFLSRKHLRKIILPKTLEEIGDWAFAYCTNLESVWLPKRQVRLGSRIFMECPGLQRIYTYEPGTAEKDLGRKQMEGTKTEEDQRAALLTAATLMLDAEYLMNLTEAGGEEWIRKWDIRMNGVMEQADEEGYTKMILCGEEDYGSNIDEFIKNKRKSKVRLAFLRLMNPIGLSAENEAGLREYLISHTKGCASEESWEVLLKEYGHKQEYFQLFADIGGVNEQNLDAILTDMSAEYAEMKAFLIRYKAEKMECRDFFDGLSLDSL